MAPLHPAHSHCTGLLTAAQEEAAPAPAGSRCEATLDPPHTPDPLPSASGHLENGAGPRHLLATGLVNHILSASEWRAVWEHADEASLGAMGEACAFSKHQLWTGPLCLV